MKKEDIRLMPLVSIGMPVYNGEKYIKDALDSILAQSFTDFELIISDNCSTDSTRKICETYAKKDSRIKYIRQVENLGASSNFKFVLKEAIGKFYMWAAHDDLWDKNWLKRLISSIKADDLAVRGKAITIDKDNRVLRINTVTSFVKGEVVRAFLDKETNAKAFYWYALFNKKLLSKIDLDLFTDKICGADSAFILHFIELGNLRTVDSTYQYYREHEASLTGGLRKNLFNYDRLAYHFFPFSYYAYNYKIVSCKYKPLLILTMPIKYFSNQFFLIIKLFRLLQSKIFSKNEKK
jgi:glycosyltransferase involved in cell wall biosynthesis